MPQGTCAWCQKATTSIYVCSTPCREEVLKKIGADCIFCSSKHDEGAFICSPCDKSKSYEEVRERITKAKQFSELIKDIFKPRIEMTLQHMGDKVAVCGNSIMVTISGNSTSIDREKLQQLVEDQMWLDKRNEEREKATVAVAVCADKEACAKRVGRKRKAK